jgi:Ca2+-binding RTX toxin-like protein
MYVRRIVLVAAIAAAFVAWPSQAHAAGPNLYRSGSQLVYIADPGEVNSLVIQLTTDGYVFDDVVNIETTYCRHYGTDLTIAVCPPEGITEIWAETKDGNDYVNHLSSTDITVLAGTGDDTVYGDAGSDSLMGEEGNDYLHGWSGNDYVTGGPGADQMFGGSGNDNATGGPGADQMFGGSGDSDRLWYDESTAGVVVDLDGTADDGMPGEGDNAGSDFEDLVGSDFNDVLVGNTADNLIAGRAGNDLIFGLAGNDALEGDWCTAWSGTFTCSTSVTLGGDYLSGGSGSDFVSYADHTASQPVVADPDGVSGDDGAAGEGDTVAADVENFNGSPGNDWLVGSAVNNQFLGGGGNDVLIGYAGNDNLNGQAGHDSILGGEGNDMLYGESGNDQLYGENHADTLNGGSGTDSCDVGPGGTSATACE